MCFKIHSEDEVKSIQKTHSYSHTSISRFFTLPSVIVTRYLISTTHTESHGMEMSLQYAPTTALLGESRCQNIPPGQYFLFLISRRTCEKDEMPSSTNAYQNS